LQLVLLCFRFPSKEDVLSDVIRITQNFLKKQPKTLVVVGAYSIGKECVYLAISKALGVRCSLSFLLDFCLYFYFKEQLFILCRLYLFGKAFHKVYGKQFML